ncbi:MAG: lytic transglycosylase domain-containing protein [Dehalococcoidia bacterium]|nr:lytic transglycosylase domain-containing protein [Dehalococcoidia bacterium]
MAIDPAASGLPSTAHVSLHQARELAVRGRIAEVSNAANFTVPSPVPEFRATARANSAIQRKPAAQASARTTTPHTPVVSSGMASPDQWDGMLNRLGQKYNVPPLFLKAVMIGESGGNPDAIGDSGHSVGLFQLHDQGYGHGMGDARFDPEVNADRAARGLAEAWHAGERAGYTGEYAVRAAYDYSFNPGGGFAYQGDGIVRIYNELLAEQGLPGLS